MKRLDVDFAPSGSARWVSSLSFWQVLSLVVLLALACVLLWQVSLQQARQTSWDTQQAVQADALQRLAVRRVPAEVSTLPPERVLAANAVIRDLQVPWSSLLDRLETAAPHDVALLEIAPDPRQRRLRLHGEASTLEGMTRYVAWLNARPGFDQVVLVRHEVVEPDPHQPVRFELELQWTEVVP